MISSSSSIRKTALSASLTSGICDQIERVRTIQVRITHRAVISTAPYHFYKVHFP